MFVDQLVETVEFTAQDGKHSHGQARLHRTEEARLLHQTGPASGQNFTGHSREVHTLQVPHADQQVPES